MRSARSSHVASAIIEGCSTTATMLFADAAPAAYFSAETAAMPTESCHQRQRKAKGGILFTIAYTIVCRDPRVLYSYTIDEETRRR